VVEGTNLATWHYYVSIRSGSGPRCVVLCVVYWCQQPKYVHLVGPINCLQYHPLIPSLASESVQCSFSDLAGHNLALTIRVVGSGARVHALLGTRAVWRGQILSLSEPKSQLLCYFRVVLVVNIVEHAAPRHFHLQPSIHSL
jgi:hypothetical protein